MYRALGKILFDIILPRGKKFNIRPYLEEGWEHSSIKIEGVSLRFLVRKPKGGNQSSPTVILAHPYLSEGRNYFLRSGIAEIYEQMGCNVYITDFNGFGTSAFRDFNFEKDLFYIGQHVSMFHPESVLILHGVSFGAAQAIVTCTVENHPFQTLVIENCLDSNMSYYKLRTPVLYHFLTFINKLRPEYAKKHVYSIQIAKLKHLQKVLFFYNEDDQLTTPAMGELLSSACNIASSMHLFRGGHLEACKKDGTLYKQTIQNVLASIEGNRRE